MSKKTSFADVAVNTVLAIMAAAAAALLCIYLIGGGASEENADNVPPPLVIKAEETYSVSETVTETEPVSVTEAEATTAPPQEETTAATTVTSAPLPPSEYDAAFFDSAFFIGDSISVGLLNYEFIKPESIFAQAGITPSSITNKVIDGKTVYQKISGFTPKYICIMLGTNGLSYLKTDDMAEKLGAFIDELKKLCPDAKITVSSIPPITRKHEDEKPEKLSTVVEYNAKLKKLAEDKDVAFADIYSLLRDESGYLSSYYAEQDGLHLKKRAYPVILSALETTINEFYGEQPIPTETAASVTSAAQTTAAAVVTEPPVSQETVSETVSAAPAAAETAPDPASENGEAAQINTEAISETASPHVSETAPSSSENVGTTETDENIEDIEVLE